MSAFSSVATADFGLFPMSTKLVAEFLSRAERSGLVTKDRLAELRDEFSEQEVSEDDPVAMADAMVASETLTRWQADKLLQGKHKGFFLGSYRLLRPLGKGGMGAVFLAEHEMMRRRCAIKVLPHTQIKEGSSVLKRFYVEAQAVAALDHQNIVRAYDVSKEVKDNKEIHYLVMEYIDGSDIQAMVQERGVLDCIQAADYLRQTANGLAHAHEAGLVHRDIKPANLLVDSRGVVKILDLGLARFFDDSGQASLTTAHNETVLGTADYLSPEQALNSHDVDLRTDIYSLGCTAYFMLTGHPPFPEGSVAQRLVAHQVKEPEPITSERKDVDPQFVQIVEHLMAKKADQRPQNATEVSQLLSAWLLEHGGEDWRRQHSELSGDSGLLSLLKHREPTRAMSSPSSETELELAPLDDDQTEEPPSAPPERPAATKPAEPEMEMAPDEEEELPMPELEELDSLDRPAQDGLFGDIGEGPDLNAVQEPGPLDSAPEDPLAVSPSLEDPLANLDDIAAAESSGTLGVLDSSVSGLGNRSPASSGASSRKLQSKDKPGALSGVKSVGLPIIIGVGGGLILVVVLLLLVFRKPPEPTAPIPNPNSVAQGRDGKDADDDSPASDVREQDNGADDDGSTPKAHSGKGKRKQRTADEDVKPRQRNQVEEDTGEVTPAAGGDAQQEDMEPPGESSDDSHAPDSASPPADDTPDDSVSKPVHSGGQPATSDASQASSARPQSREAGTSADPSEPDITPQPNEPTPPLELTDEDKKRLLSQITEIHLALDFPRTEDRFPATVERLMEETVLDLGWKIRDEAATEMQVVVTAEQSADYIVYLMNASIVYSDNRYKDASLWQCKEPVELFRYRANTKPSGFQITTMLNMCRKEAGKMFSRFKHEVKSD